MVFKNNMPVVLGPPLMLGEATVAERHQEGDQHSSSRFILLGGKRFQFEDVMARFSNTA